MNVVSPFYGTQCRNDYASYIRTVVACQDLESAAAFVRLPFADTGLGTVTGAFAFARIVINRDTLWVFLDTLPQAL